MVGRPVSIFNARVKAVCLCWHKTGKKRGVSLFGISEFDRMDRIVYNNKQGKTGMKTEKTLRTAKNSLLCFFMALGAGFLVACGGGGGGGSVTPQEFPVYLVDTAVEGVEYSGPEGDGLTGKGGVFLANEGEFVFSIGGTTLGSVSLNSDWANNEVTPADFIGVNELQVITIARFMQALDEDAVPGGPGLGLQNGISISQATRDDPENVSLLYSRVRTSGEEITGNSVGDNNQQYTIPSVDGASDHLAATRRCLFSGGYVGNFEGTLLSNGAELRGRSYYAVEPFANRVRRFTSGGNADFQSFETTSTVGVIGSAIILDAGNTLSFITPRLVTGVWQFARSDNVISSGTHNNLTLAADTGNPGATRRIVGVETTGTGTTVAGMYVLDYFEGATVFLGRYYGVNATLTIDAVSSVPLSLTIANSPSWPVSADGVSDGMTTVTLTLSGMRGEEDVSITVGIVRAMLGANANENYGRFEGVGSELSGTWCDIGGAVGSTVAPTPLPRTPPAPAPRASAISHTQIEVSWGETPRATAYKLYRRASGGSYGDSPVDDDISALSYLDTGLTRGTEYFYRLEACNSTGCSERSPEVSATTHATPPAQLGQCRVGLALEPGQSCAYLRHTFSVSSSSGGLSELSAEGPSNALTSRSVSRADGVPREATARITDDRSGALLGELVFNNSGDDNIWRITSRR